MNLLTIAFSDALMEFGLPIPINLGSARLEALVLLGGLLLSENTVRVRLNLKV